jgi:hypothetical protein
VVDVPNTAAFTAEHRKVYRKWKKSQEEDRQFQAMWDAEIRNGA